MADKKDRFIGQSLQGTYRIERQLGKGGMGAVYEASHCRLPRRFAVKMLAGELTDDAEALARFRREAEVTSALGHPHIVEVVDFNLTDDDEPYIVMELLRGQDLAALINGCGPLELLRAAAIFKQASLALSSAHARGIIHRDLKPPNIFLCSGEARDDFVKVVDFGISKVLSSQSKLTRTHQLMGTPLYMAPEQVDEKSAAVDLRVDVYAMGVILFEMLTGHPPFTGETLTGLLLKILQEPPPVLGTLRSDLPAPLNGVIQQALAKSPGDRFESMDVFWQALAAAIGWQESSPTVGSEPEPAVDVFGETVAREASKKEPAWTPAMAPDHIGISVPQAPAPAPEDVLGHGASLVERVPASIPETVDITDHAASAKQTSAPLSVQESFRDVGVDTAALAGPGPVAGRGRMALLVGGIALALVAGAAVTVLVHGDGSRAERTASAGKEGKEGVKNDVEATAAGREPGKPSPGNAPAPTLPDKETSPPSGKRTAHGAEVLITAGAFLRGSRVSRDERPPGSVYLDAFYVDRREVTVRQYRRCVSAGACTAAGIGQDCNWIVASRRDHPVNCVDWFQARGYCRWAGKRLPTEAEWEKAARGTDGRKFPWGNAPESCSRAVMNQGSPGCGALSTWRVGSKSPAGDSPHGVQDMGGNVWEWCQDWYDRQYYLSAPQRNPPGPATGKRRVIRGGSWKNKYNPSVRSADRGYAPPRYRKHNLGFRCARSAR